MPSKGHTPRRPRLTFDEWLSYRRHLRRFDQELARQLREQVRARISETLAGYAEPPKTPVVTSPAVPQVSGIEDVLRRVEERGFLVLGNHVGMMSRRVGIDVEFLPTEAQQDGTGAKFTLTTALDRRSRLVAAALTMVCLG